MNRSVQGESFDLLNPSQRGWAFSLDWSEVRLELTNAGCSPCVSGQGLYVNIIALAAKNWYAATNTCHLVAGLLRLIRH